MLAFESFPVRPDHVLPRIRARGSQSRSFVSRQEPTWRAHGTLDRAERAFDDIADPFLAESYWMFLDVDEELPEKKRERAVRKVVRAGWAEFGVKLSDLVFALDEIEVEQAHQGRGIGRAAVADLEAMAKVDGAKAVILQAGALYGAPSLGFWKKVGYTIWRGEYGRYTDRIVVKVLP